MEKTVIRTEEAPRAIGPYEQGIQAGSMLYTSGQIPLDPVTGHVEGHTIEEQTRRVFDNLRAVLEAGNSSLDRVVKVTVFLTDLGEFSRFNEVYAGYFPESRPARSTVQVAGLPRGVKIEAEAVALCGG
jgi:2-iminobutanoate/2-iminopropanoate deaminase